MRDSLHVDLVSSRVVWLNYCMHARASLIYSLDGSEKGQIRWNVLQIHNRAPVLISFTPVTGTLMFSHSGSDLTFLWSPNNKLIDPKQNRILTSAFGLNQNQSPFQENGMNNVSHMQTMHFSLHTDTHTHTRDATREPVPTTRIMSGELPARERSGCFRGKDAAPDKSVALFSLTVRPSRDIS